MGRASAMEMVIAKPWSGQRVRLTDREMEIARLLSRGNSRAEIILGLNLAESTVDKHLRRIKDRLGARSLTDLVLAARSYIEETVGTGADGKRSSFPFGIAQDRADLRSLGAISLADWAKAPNARAPETAESGMTDFAKAKDFPELFAALERNLIQLGLPWVAWCHISRRAAGAISMENARMNFSVEMFPDLAVRADANPLFRHSMTDWSPLVIDKSIQGRTHRMIVVPLPGATMLDRIVAAVSPGPEVVGDFNEWAQQVQPRLMAVLLYARHMHLTLSQRGVDLELQALVNALAGGETMEEAASIAGLSRRTAERMLTNSRHALHCRSNMELVCLLRQQYSLGRFDFGMSPP